MKIYFYVYRYAYNFFLLLLLYFIMILFVGDHGWHVHLLPVDQTLDPAEQCAVVHVGPHYDPFNKSVDGNYSMDCMADRTE